MSLTIQSCNSANLSTSTSSNISKSSTVTEIFNIGENTKSQISNDKKNAKIDLERRVTELLDLKDNFLKVSVIERNGISYVQLTRPQDDQLRSNQRKDFQMGAIKRKLGIKEGVLKQNNDLKDITGRNLNEESNSATLEKGKSLIIPLKDLGENFSWYQFSSSNIVDYVQKYLGAK